MESVTSLQSIKHPLLPYRIALVLASPLLLAYTLWRAGRDGGTVYLKQRLGLQLPVLKGPLWTHCASVGEVNAALPLLKALRARHPDVPLLVTTNTPTGRQVLLQHMPQAARHAFLPLDFGACVTRFVDSTRPRCALIMETELWPNLYRQCAARDISLVLINARLSDRTATAPVFMRRAYRYALAGVRAVLARSASDADKFKDLGAPRARIETLGNLKFARPYNEDQTVWTADPVGRPYWLAASTHHDEELRIARVWRRLSEHNHLLVIAPRHPERRTEILRQLRSLRLKIAVRSRGDAVHPSTRIYLADTLGELTAFMTHASLVFMGGSLIERGGHNLLEPACLGKAVLVGPHMHHFADETQSLLAAEAIMMVRNDHELAYALERLLTDDELRTALGGRAAAFMAKQVDIVEAYLARLEPLCDLR